MIIKSECVHTFFSGIGGGIGGLSEGLTGPCRGDSGELASPVLEPRDSEDSLSVMSSSDSAAINLFFPLYRIERS